MIAVMVRIPVGAPEEGDRLEARFKNRSHLVDDQPGFLGFELMRSEHEIVSVTRWATRDDFRRWSESESNAVAHARVPAPTTAGHPHAAGGEAAEGGSGPEASSVTVYEIVIPAAGEQS